MVLDDLPENLVFDILVRLPLETLCCSKFVCKSWYGIINSPDFINAHLRRSDTTTRGLIFLTPFENYSSVPPKKVFSIESNSMLVDRPMSIHMKFMETKDGKSTIKDYYNTAFRGKIVATCNGVIVLKNYVPQTRLILHNPVTRELEDIPLGSISSSEHDSYGLAFCQASRRYKLLHLFTKDKFGCEIMDIGSGSWRAVNVPPTNHFGLLQNPIFVLGALHWIQYVVDCGGECMVISMLLDDEKYKTMAIPKTYHLHFKSVFAMGEFLGFAGRLEGGNPLIGVWILRGECGWEKQYNIDVESGFGYYKTNLLYFCSGVFVFKTAAGSLYAYDRHSRLMRKIETTYKWITSFAHANSLVSWRS